eukprot:CAMPEP_0195515752 /NCGR_PEP_ID=MMETSP0794_2-20130614/6713_1 /TAXON_ID=515487 /ORGANISM="Stephanopyxis turris, Strain CCMP 815" /LENGTH=322 /DNA_ID=CAMNT_0040644227 /DNA_START=28 /DNA_END=996 /DNA_ORIENTATION=-
MTVANVEETAFKEQSSPTKPSSESALEDQYYKVCHEMVLNLTQDEKEHAARTSYKYFMLSISQTGSKPSEAEQLKCAMAMAKRHLIAENGDQECALKKMKNTIQYRKDINVDGIRRAFYEKEGPDEEKNKEYQHIRNNLEHQMSTGIVHVRGYDTRKAANYIAFPRLKISDDPEWYIKANIYTLERALACSERASEGEVEKVCCFFDYSGYKSKHSPPVTLIRDLFFCLRDHYPERMKHVFIVDAPVIFRSFWYLIRPFLDPVTKSKVKFVAGEVQKQEVFAGIINKDQAMNFMYPDGGKTKEMNVMEFLYDIPYDHAFDED